MTGDVRLLFIITGIHVFGFAAVVVLMFPAIREGWHTPPDGSSGESDDGWGRGPDTPPASPPPAPDGGLPLPDAVPARVRFREPGRLADRLPPRERRPAREPVRVPQRERV
jgi:hypothetical protein